MFRVGDDKGSVEGEHVTPDRCSSSGLRSDDDQSGTGFVDLGNGLHDTAEVGAADVSARVPREVHDGRMPDQIAVGHDLPVGILELEGGEPLHPASVSGG